MEGSWKFASQLSPLLPALAFALYATHVENCVRLGGAIELLKISINTVNHLSLQQALSSQINYYFFVEECIVKLQLDYAGLITQINFFIIDIKDCCTPIYMLCFKLMYPLLARNRNLSSNARVLEAHLFEFAPIPPELWVNSAYPMAQLCWPSPHFTALRIIAISA